MTWIVVMMVMMMILMITVIAVLPIVKPMSVVLVSKQPGFIAS